MLTPARRALPGMAVVAMLAFPAYAAPTTTADSAPNTTTPSQTATAPAPKKRAQTKPTPAKAATVASKPSPTGQATAEPSFTAYAPSAPILSGSPILSDSKTTIWRQTGIASWYGGKRWQGNRTASGARYNQNQLTAAHATLPIGTRVRVTMEGSDRSVVVLINDRPGTRTRIIDLSRQAAADLGILAQGLAVVTLTAL